MLVAYFKTDTSGPVRFLCTPDGRIDFIELGQEFGLDPMSIDLNGTRIPKTRGLKLDIIWKQIEEFFKQKGKPVGTEDDHVMVTSDKAPVHPVSIGMFHRKAPG